MRLSRSMVLLVLPCVATTLLGGCNPTPTPPPAAPMPQAPTQQQAEAVQAEILRVSPDWVVGKVAGVLGNQSMVAVTGIPFASVKPPKSIQFLDGNSKVIANGTVSTASQSDSQYLIVEYVPASAAGGRAPVVGDLAVYIPTK